MTDLLMDDDAPWCLDCNAPDAGSCVCDLPEAQVFQGKPAMGVLDMVDLARMLVTSVSQGVDEELFQRVNGFNMAVELKIEACYHIIRRLESESDLLKSEMDRLQARKKALDNRSRRIRDSVAQLIDAQEPLSDSNKVRTPTVTASTGRSWAVEGPESVSEWPEEYQKAREPVPDRHKAREALKRGAQIPGLTLKQRLFVRFR